MKHLNITARFAFCIYIAVALLACAKKEVRADEEIRAVLEQHSERLYGIFAGFLSEKPDLGGRMVYGITIEPSGQVFECRVQESEIQNPAVGEAICGGIKTIDFGKKNADVKTISHPLLFYPR